MYLGLNIGSLLFEGEPLDTNSGDPVNIALPKLQQETNSASTPASKLLSDYIIAEVENNSNRIDENVLKTDFYNTLDKKCQGVHHQSFEELSKQSLKNALEFQGRADEDFIKEKVSDIDIGSLLFTGELLDTNSGDSVNIALPKLQQQTDSASTPASKLLSDYTIAEVKNNSNRIDENVLKTDFYNTLDKKCQGVHHQNFKELSKQSLKNALEFQGKVYRDFTKEKVKLLELQSVSPDEYKYPCIVTDCSFTHKHRAFIKRHLFKHIKVSQHYCEQCLPYTFFARDKTELNRHIGYHHSTDSTLSKYGAKRICPPDQNTMNSFSECNVSQVSDQQQTDSASTPVSNLLFDYTIAQLENNSNHIDESVLKADFYNKYQDHGNRIFYSSTPSNSEVSVNSQILKYGAKRICPPDQSTMNFFSECNVSQVSDQQQTDSASAPASKLLSDCTIAEVENNSTRIDESVLKEDFYNTLDKKCQEVHHQNFEELSRQSLKNALEFQGRVYQGFTKEKVKLPELQSVSPDEYKYPCIVTDCSFTHKHRAFIKRHLFKHIKVSQHYCEQCLPYTFFARDIANLDEHKKSVHFLDKVISKHVINRIHQHVQNTINGSNRFTVNQVSDQQQKDSASTLASNLLSDYTIAEVENNSNRIDESILKTDFYETLDKICQEVHHQNFEELSKQSLKNALEFQGRVYQDFTKEKAKLSEKQLVSSDKCEYPCIVTDCSFTHKYRVTIKRHLFKHIKVSPYYCEQCLPNTFFAQDIASLNKHKRSVHFLDKVISKRGINQIHQPVQNTINGSSGFTVNQESAPCSLLNSAKRAKTDP